MFAGLETMATTIANTLYCLALNPECQENLYNQLSDLYPEPESMNYENSRDSPMLEAVLKESQRMLPVLSIMFRIAENPIEIKGVKIQAGDTLAIDVNGIHHNEEYWPSPDTFRPERFLEKEFKFVDDENSIFLPFGTGTVVRLKPVRLNSNCFI